MLSGFVFGVQKEKRNFPQLNFNFVPSRVFLVTVNAPGSNYWGSGDQDRDEHQLDSQSHLKRNVSSKVLVILLCDSSNSVRKESGVLYMSLEYK